MFSFQLPIVFSFRMPITKRERLDESVQDRFGPLGGQRDGEGRVRVAPGDHQHRHLLAAVGKVDVDVAEVGLGPDAGSVVERNEGRSAVESPGLQVATDRVVAAGVAVLGDEPAVDLHGGMSLLAGCGLVGGEDSVDNLLHGTEDGRRSRLGERVGFGLRLGDRFANGVASDGELLGDLAGTETFAVKLANPGKIVHGTHPCPPATASLPHAEVVLPLAQNSVPKWT